jgi:hypothetical protein
MAKMFKTIHMPTRFHEEIEDFTHRSGVSYKTVAEVCRCAGEMLIQHYNLRPALSCPQTEKVTNQ